MRDLHTTTVEAAAAWVWNDDADDDRPTLAELGDEAEVAEEDA